MTNAIYDNINRHVFINNTLLNYIIDNWHEYIQKPHPNNWTRVNGLPHTNLAKNINLISDNILRSNMFYIFAKNYILTTNKTIQLSIYQIIKIVIRSCLSNINFSKINKYILEISPNNIYCDFENNLYYSISKLYYYILLPFIEILKNDNYFYYLINKL